MFLTEGGEKEPFSNKQSILFFLTSLPPRETILPELKLLGFYQSLADLGEGKYPTAIHCSYPVPPKGGKN